MTKITTFVDIDIAYVDGYREVHYDYSFEPSFRKMVFFINRRITYRWGVPGRNMDMIATSIEKFIRDKNWELSNG